MRDGDLADGEATGDGEGGEEGIHRAQRDESARDFAAENLEGAAGIGDAVAERFAADEICGARHGFAQGRVFALGAGAGDHVGGVAQLPQARELGRRILAVAIEHGEIGAAGFVKTVEERGGLAAVFREMDDAKRGPGGGDGVELGAGGVAAAVVDDEDFVRGAESVEGGAELGEERTDVFRFVVEWDDDGELGGGAGRGHAGEGTGARWRVRAERTGNFFPAWMTRRKRMRNSRATACVGGA